jgi:hypothetical protein
MAPIDVHILHVPDCPNAALAVERVRAASAGRTDVRVAAVEITDEAEATRAGMRGSPTILVDGADPLSPPGQPIGMACRVAPGGDPVPSVATIRAALRG